MNTHKTQFTWLESIINNLPADMITGGNPFATVAANVRAVAGDYRYYKTPQQAATAYLQGCGLCGFPIATAEHIEILQSWGYSAKVAERAADNFFTVSGGLLVEVLRAHGENL